MSLKAQFARDLENIFLNKDEFAEEREFRVSDGQGGFKVFLATVVWDEEAVKEMPVVKNLGIFMGDVRCYIPKRHLPRRPLADEIIYSPANRPWEVMECIHEESCYVLALRATRSQPD